RAPLKAPARALARRRLPRHRAAEPDPHLDRAEGPHRLGRGPERRRRAAPWPALRDRRADRPRAGDRRQRLSDRDERGPLGRPVRRSPPPPPDGRPGLRLAARMTDLGRGRHGPPPLGPSLAAAWLIAGVVVGCGVAANGAPPSLPAAS